MTKKYEIILKKEYTKPSIDGYVWLKQYTIIKRDGQRYAIVRFSNDMGVRIDRLFFALDQLDSNGRVIASRGDKYALDVGLDAGISFEKEIAVDENCVAVKLRVDKVRSCGNEYSLNDGQITVVSNIDSIKNEDISPELLIPKNEEKSSSQWKLTAISIAAIAVALMINFLVALLHTLR